MIKLDIKGNENRGCNLVIEENKGIYKMKTTNTVNKIDLDNGNANEVRNIKTNNSEVGVINMSMQGNNALKIEKQVEEKKRGFKLKINKFDISFEIKTNEEREMELKVKKFNNIQNLKAVEADREKMAIKFLGDL